MLVCPLMFMHTAYPMYKQLRGLVARGSSSWLFFFAVCKVTSNMILEGGFASGIATQEANGMPIFA